MRVVTKLFLGLTLLGAAHANAFSLLGPYEDWMQRTNGFRFSGDIGGPMNLGEEYRWNVPVLTYAFDSSFLDYFGSNGVTAVEQAIQILNDLPPASQLNPTNYPIEALRRNYQAQALGLTDLKSETLQLLLEQLGLAQPTRYAYCMRSFTGWPSGGGIQAVIVQRNFDPIDFIPSIAVNDSDYGYTISYDVYSQTNGLQYSVYPTVFPLDPLDTLSPAVADGSLPQGGFFTGLTRDDVGGLHYLLRTNNSNLEVLLPGVHVIGSNAGNFVNEAVRPGLDKITFLRRDFDELLGQYFTPFTNQFADTYISNNTPVQQQLERVVTEPDFLFCASDLSDTYGAGPLVVRTGTTNWWKSNLPGLAGPGVIRPPIGFTFNKQILNPAVYTHDMLPDADVSPGIHWASFDGSTNLPVIYPSGLALSPITNTLAVHLWLHDASWSKADSFSWNLPIPLGGRANLLAATNLTDWVWLGSVTNSGYPVDWHHTRSMDQRFLRVVPD